MGVSIINIMGSYNILLKESLSLKPRGFDQSFPSKMNGERPPNAMIIVGYGQCVESLPVNLNAT
jgi:hypothetical protein